MKLTIILLSLLIALIILGFTIESPNRFTAPIKVTASSPPVSLIAEHSGKIEILDFERHTDVEKGTYLATVGNTGKHEDIRELQNHLLSLGQSKPFLSYKDLDFAINYDLGEIQQPYFSLLNSLYELELENEKGEYDIKMSYFDLQLKKHASLDSMREKLKNIRLQEIDFLVKRADEDSVLYTKGMLSIESYNNSIMDLLRQRESLLNIDFENIKAEQSALALHQEVNLFEWQRRVKHDALKLKIMSSYHSLLFSINEWEKKHVIKAPISGKIEYITYITSNQFVTQGDELFSILPSDSKIVGHILVGGEGVGKIQKGQTVFVMLTAFPHHEFGRLVATINNISLIPKQSEYLVLVEFPNGLISDLGIELSFGANMEGIAEIITTRRKIIFKVFDQLYSAFSWDFKNKEDKNEKNTKQ